MDLLGCFDSIASLRLLSADNVSTGPHDYGHPLVHLGSIAVFPHVSGLLPTWRPRCTVAALHCRVPGLSDRYRTQLLRGLCGSEFAPAEEVGPCLSTGNNGFVGGVRRQWYRRTEGCTDAAIRINMGGYLLM